MSRIGRNELARYEGARWFYEMIKKRGFDEAVEELKWRGALSVPLNLEHSEVIRFEQYSKAHMIKTIMCMSILTLHDEFDFNTEMCTRFMSRFNRKTDCLEDDFSTWADYAQILRDELDIELDYDREFDREAEELRKKWRKERLEGHR